MLLKHSGKSHILTKKTRKRKNRIKKDFVILDNVHKKAMVRLLPYGVGR